MADRCWKPRGPLLPVGLTEKGIQVHTARDMVRPLFEGGFEPMTDYAALRKNMVESQVRTNDVTDRRVLRAMLDLPREDFVPQAMKALAYSDEDLPLAKGLGARRLPAPVSVARLIQLADVNATDKVLEVGSGTGYGTAILATLAASVTGVESDESLVAAARKSLADAGHGSVAVKSGPLAEGVAGNGPYDVIIVAGAIPEVPAALRQQVKDGGRLVAVIADGRLGRATVFTKRGESFSGRKVFDAVLPPLPGFEKKREFAL